MDVFSKAKRSQIMSQVKDRGNAATELRLIRLFRQHGIAGWRRHSRLLGKPDFVLPKNRLAVFVDGCFWHSCPRHATQPASNRAFWKKKLSANKARDRFVNRALRGRGWHVIRIWQHELNRREEARLVRRIRRRLDKLA